MPWAILTSPLPGIIGSIGRRVGGGDPRFGVRRGREFVIKIDEQFDEGHQKVDT